MASVWGELKRRNVVKVAVAYAIVGWLLVQVADTFFPALQLPEWTVTLVAGLVILGFPIALILSWAYELTPDGMERAKSVPLSESIAKVTGRKLDFVIIGLMALGILFLVVDNYVLDTASPFAGAEIDPGSLEPALNESPSTVAEVATEAPTPDRRSIAVLPFSNESAAEENAEFFANGIHDELLTQLAQIGSLKVISRTSVEEYRDTSKNMRQIGQELGVATLLEGRVQRAGDMVRVNVQLIDAETDVHLWADTYERELTMENIFAIQAEMAISIAGALQATLTPQEVAQLSEIPTQSTRAWNYYVAGNNYFHRTSDAGSSLNGLLAVEQYEHAVDDDSEFSEAWAALSRAHSTIYLYSGRTDDAALNSAIEAVELAFELAPNAPETRLARAQYFFTVTLDYEAALQELTIAEQAWPNTADIFKTRAYIQRRANNWEDAAVNMTRAAELDPRNVDTLGQLLATNLHLRNYSDAERLNERMRVIAPESAEARLYQIMIPALRDGDFTDLRAALESQQRFPFALTNSWLTAINDREYETATGYLDEWDSDADVTQNWYVPKASYYGVTYELAGQSELAASYFVDALTQVEEALRASPDDARLLVALAEIKLGQGERDEAIATAIRATQLMPRSVDALSATWIQLDAIRRVLAPAGYSDALIEQLDDYLTENGWWSIEGLLQDPRFDPVREDPRFEVLVEKYRRR